MCKHDWKPLYKRPTDVGGRLTYTLRGLADYQVCSRCERVGVYSSHARRRFNLLHPVFAESERGRAAEWNDAEPTLHVGAGEEGG